MNATNNKDIEFGNDTDKETVFIVDQSHLTITWND